MKRRALRDWRAGRFCGAWWRCVMFALRPDGVALLPAMRHLSPALRCFLTACISLLYLPPSCALLPFFPHTPSCP
uniref:Uncharacterized protein n=1 Tax=Trypanosoma vivax (strain Y486) TaxID=1055687 RepID=G0TTI8_TRYVY|nr:hypothetical protein TVY486_0304420 [Trypanosoma vivax Y486]